MKKFIISFLVIIFIAGSITKSYASDWDKAGKILTGIEGLRILTGGRFDAVGTLIGSTGYRNEREDYKPYDKHHNRHNRRPHDRQYSRCKERIWIPHYEWHKKQIPAHVEYDDHLGEVHVEEHYIKYKVQSGGHWEASYSCY